MRYIVIAAWGDWAKFVPENTACGKRFVGVVATPEGARGSNERWFLVPAAEYDCRQGFDFVVDVGRHQEIVAPTDSDRS